MSNFAPSGASDWELRLNAILPLFGHRNWIVVADSAYPLQSRPGIETVVSGEDQLTVVRAVLDAIRSSLHVRAQVHADKELAFVSEQDSPGVTDYRQQLSALLHGSTVKYTLHEEIITRLDSFSEVFNVFIIKTNMTIPYTSVFFELDCGYWNPGARERLQQAMLFADLK